MIIASMIPSYSLLADVLMLSPYQLFALTTIVTLPQVLGHETWTKPVPLGVNVLA
ncbi:MAG: hypothetical protein NZ931_02910 [Aigarchaeota archaeon]|nr:hypothetical protein [Aigarchaeota archaeon]